MALSGTTPSGSSCSDDSDSESDGIPALEDMTDSSSDWESEEEELEQEGAEIDPGLTVGDIDEATDRVNKQTSFNVRVQDRKSD